MATIVTKSNRDSYLRLRDRFYQCGWLDAERGDNPQVEFGDLHSDRESYLIGYNDSMHNLFVMSSLSSVK
jgi:hypothetical protein